MVVIHYSHVLLVIYSWPKNSLDDKISKEKETNKQTNNENIPYNYIVLGCLLNYNKNKIKIEPNTIKIN
jgi:hypothetical protein